MRKTISHTPVRTGVVFMLFPIIFSAYAVYLSFSEGYSHELLIMFFLPGIFGYLSFYILTKIKNVEYDSKYMYIVTRKYETQVSYDEITRVHMTGSSISRWNIWKIDYLDNDGSRLNVHIYPKGYVKELDQFFLQLWERNNDIEIDHWLPPDKRDAAQSD